MAKVIATPSTASEIPVREPNELPDTGGGVVIFDGSRILTVVSILYLHLSEGCEPINHVGNPILRNQVQGGYFGTVDESIVSLFRNCEVSALKGSQLLSVV